MYPGASPAPGIAGDRWWRAGIPVAILESAVNCELEDRRTGRRRRSSRKALQAIAGGRRQAQQGASHGELPPNSPPSCPSGKGQAYQRSPAVASTPPPAASATTTISDRRQLPASHGQHHISRSSATVILYANQAAKAVLEPPNWSHPSRRLHQRQRGRRVLGG